MNQHDFDLTYNPFDDADNDHELTRNTNNTQRQYFGSAFVSSSSAPVLARRKSSGAESQRSSGSTIRRRQKRSRSNLRLDAEEDDDRHPPPVPSVHPLRSALLKAGQFEDFGVTRPHLSRVVQSSSVDNSLFGGSSDTDDGDGIPPVRVPETEVLVHMVQPSDSLAGVSLKYGIDLIELRRANQLWANDSIHLRETIYIPLHRASRAHEYVVRAPVESSPGSPSTSSSSLPGNEFDPLSSTPSSPVTVAANVRRVPVSQLSYFPPPSNPYRSNTTSDLPSPPLGGPASRSKPPPPPRNQATPNHSLTSLLNALPIAASTRDEIVSRLSLDSTSSSYSDRARPEENTGHELNSVNGPGRPIINNHRGRSPDRYSDIQHTPKPTSSHRPRDTSLRERESSANGRTSDLGKSHPAHARVKLSTSPSSYVPQTHNPYVRTSQMEPSPAMKLPLTRSNSESNGSTVTRNSRRLGSKHQQYTSENGLVDLRNGDTHRS